ncbi:MAG: CoA transferase [Deltaproteobacteria bacterium]|jgi:crotonobetainyl-CoA:carnitine CoA-transferase CaiB-like acyl-CoA transferase|nr:CoA transferase [Deltaproteobacteria bacterium]MBW2498700.1 CoA transferase [Deltaproteobacteria bacterium]
MPGPLAGYRVVDLSTMISGPMATMLLGDQGADVIKVEAPGRGDLVRHLGRARDGISATFATTNRNKRSIVLDLKDRAGRETFDALVATADVFVQNFRPGVAERMGIGEASLRALRPDLVYVSICGFGETGPYARKRVYDPLIQALSGLATIQGDRGVGRPRMVRLIVPDKVTALTAAQAITAALLARERTGEGQHVRLSMIDAMVALAWPEGMAGLTFVEGEKEIPRNALAQDLVYETADGWMTAGAVSDSEWQGLARALEHPEWLEDDRFVTPAGRVAYAKERLDQTAAVLKTRTTAEWLERLDAEEVPCAPILPLSEIVKHPQIRANELLVESEHPAAGRIRQPRPAARFDRTPAGIERPAPTLGEHTQEILCELGLETRESPDAAATSGSDA